MKIYTNTFDLRQPSEKKFWVAPHSDFKIGINVLGYNGTEMTYPPSNIDLYKDGVKLTVDSNDGNMTYWKIKSEGTGEVTYTVKAKRNNNKVVGELKLIQVVTDSTVYEQESGGEIPEILDVKSVKTQNLIVANSYGINSTGGGCFKKVSVPDANVYIDGELDGMTIGRINLNGCTGKGIFESINTSNGEVVIRQDDVIIQSNNNPTLEVTGGCGAMPKIYLYYGHGNEQVYISPSINSQYFDKEFMFQPYFMQELNGGCGGYVLAAFL